MLKSVIWHTDCSHYHNPNLHDVTQVELMGEFSSVAGLANPAVRPGYHNSCSKGLPVAAGSKTWIFGSWIRAAGKGLACDIVVCLRGPATLGQLGRMWFLPLFHGAHKPYELEGKWPSRLLSLDADPDHCRALTCSSRLSNSLLLGPRPSSM